jgi:hypothetical protein
MRDLDKRLERLEAVLPGGGRRLDEWPLEDQLESVVDMLLISKWGRTAYQATDREQDLLDALIEQETISEGARELFTRMNPARQPERERWLAGNWQEAKAWRELAQARIAWHREHGYDKHTPKHLLPAG